MPVHKKSPVLVLDLDGTILRCNSFPLWMQFLIGSRIPGLGARRRALLSLRALMLLVLRKMGLFNHDTLLRGAQRAWSAAAADEGEKPMERFQARLQRHVRPNLRSLLGLVAANQVDAVLATAACADYAFGLGDRLGFQHKLATPAHRQPSDPPNRGPHKRDRVLAFLDDIGWTGRPLILLTDHIDDLPLIRESNLVCWFGPATHMAATRASTDNVSFIFCRDLTDEAVLVTLLALSDGVTAPPVDRDTGA